MSTGQDKSSAQHEAYGHSIVIGGGVIGLAIAWRLARRGARVTILERGQTGQESSRVAAGMLAAAAEVGFEEFELYELCRASLKEWPSFVRELKDDSGIDTDYSSFGTLVVADDRDSAEALKRGFDFQKAQGYPVEWLSGSEALDLEPFLSPRISAAVSAKGDHSVDNRKLLEALQVAILKRGGEIREYCPVKSVDLAGEQVSVHLESGEEIVGSRIVLAAGAWSRQIEGLPQEAIPPVRPVKGQILELKMEAPFSLSHVIRGPKAYLVPRSDGRLFVGATSEEMGFDSRLTAGGVHGVLDGAWELVPGILDQEILGAHVGFRPGSRDNQPLVGFAGDHRLFVATGHYRHGILLSAITALSAEESILDETERDVMSFFSPERFLGTRN